ncbi:hypothetical protein B0T22DRAFT_276297 [Podospora appendiculata]|uniref:Uncharacterized protein n=1 Tax=Podospora appendiculata TaxID=314037 RepID=A0AAE1C7V4_9PEZI|nr:hypothetical protein B0T22DRAFT_276297 [Podospora appendiculata]
MTTVPPATRDAWSYSGDLHVEVSGHNRHRRAAVPELKAHFDGSDGPKDRPAHWYEAQLIHYGLPPSKTKGTAKMRLFEAVNRGNLTVPPHIGRLESELKKEWAKNEREAKQALKKQAATPATTTRAGKRKADDTPASLGTGNNVSINLSVSIGPQGNLLVGTADSGPAAKKARATKTAPSSATKTPKTTPKTAPKTAPKAVSAVKAAPVKKEATLVPPKSTAAPPSVPRTKQTARRGTSSTASRAVSSRPAIAAASPSPPRRIQYARRGGAMAYSGKGRPVIVNGGVSEYAASSYGNRDDDDDDGDDEPPPPYPGSPRGYYGTSDDDHDRRRGYSSQQPQSSQPPSSQLPPLGLLNGRYDVHCIDSMPNSHLILTLDGNALWGAFDIGPLSGVLRLDQRPYQSSHSPLYFQWRGRDTQDGEHDETDDGSFIKFLGDGRIEGEIGFYHRMVTFEGHRVGGQGTRSEINTRQMRNDWDNLP